MKMKSPSKKCKQLREAELMATRWLYYGNRAMERNDKDLAERHYARAQKWHDLMNRLLGNG